MFVNNEWSYSPTWAINKLSKPIGTQCIAGVQGSAMLSVKLLKLQGQILMIILSFVSLSVRQLHREFLRAGANVIQTFTFYCSEDKLEISGNVKSITVSTKPFNQTTMKTISI